jgi:hypothetical protein
MPHPLFLKVMGALPHQYNALTAVQKDEFNAEAQSRLIELQTDDMEAFIALTEEPVTPPDTDKRPINSERRFF